MLGIIRRISGIGFQPVVFNSQARSLCYLQAGSSCYIRNRAFTLLEVIVGLLLMGSLVASGLVALSSHQHSILLAKQKQQANHVAEALLTNWYEVQGRVPIRDQGLVLANGEWLWRTQPVGMRSVCGLPANIIRFEILGRAEKNTDPQVFASIELLQNQNASGLR